MSEWVQHWIFFLLKKSERIEILLLVEKFRRVGKESKARSGHDFYGLFVLPVSEVRHILDPRWDPSLGGRDQTEGESSESVKDKKSHDSKV